MAPPETSHQEKKSKKLFSLFSRHKASDLEQQQQAYAATHELQWAASPTSILHIVQDMALDDEKTAALVKALQRICEIKVEAESAHHEFIVTMRIQLQPATEATRTKPAMANHIVYLPAIRSMQQLEIKRPFAEFRTLQKTIEACTTQKQCRNAKCGYCQQVAAYAVACWRQPPIVNESFSGGTMHSVRVFNVRVLASSMLRFVDLVRSNQAAALPKHDECHARATLSILLCDFFQLENHSQEQQQSVSAAHKSDVSEL